MSSFNSVMDPKSTTSVADFYAGRSVFITGGTGFLGKVFIEKLLYCCPLIENIYILIREKKNVKVEQRVQDLTNNPLFAKLREKRPEDLKKIIPIIGEITAINLGISYEDEQVLIDKVSVVFHSAATIKFNEPLKDALKINLEGTKKVLDLSKRMKNIHAFVHVSTAYSNTDKEIIQEIVYPPPAKISDVYKLLEEYGDDEEQTTKLLNGRPNTYTFTKALAETYVSENHGEVPTIIVRPSIVTSVLHEPAGWLDNWNGPTSLLMAGCKGVYRVMAGSGKYIADIIPVDYVSNLTLVAAAKHNRSNEVSVYNCCTSSRNPITWRTLFTLFCEEGVKLKMNDLPYPSMIFLKSEWLVSLLSFLLQILPAFFGDLWLRFKGRKPRYMKIQSQLYSIRKMQKYFTSHLWLMRTNQVRALTNSLSPIDRQQFPCDPATIDWKTYIPQYCQGVKRYLLANKK